jgi:hypothetical protein
MAASFTITVTPPESGTRAIELMWIERALHLAAQEVRAAGGGKTTGTVHDGRTRDLATYTYAPGAAS